MEQNRRNEGHDVLYIEGSGSGMQDHSSIGGNGGTHCTIEGSGSKQME